MNHIHPRFGISKLGDKGYVGEACFDVYDNGSFYYAKSSQLDIAISAETIQELIEGIPITIKDIYGNNNFDYEIKLTLKKNAYWPE